MAWFSKKQKFNWKEIHSLSDWRRLLEKSEQLPVAVFKHSTRCSISSMAKQRIERDWDIDETELPLYYLDLIQHRDISNAIAQDLAVEHQSPQLIVFKNRKPIYAKSHNSISVEGVKNSLEK